MRWPWRRPPPTPAPEPPKWTRLELLEFHNALTRARIGLRAGTMTEQEATELVVRVGTRIVMRHLAEAIQYEATKETYLKSHKRGGIQDDTGA